MTEVEILRWIAMTLLAGWGYFIKRTVDKNDEKVANLEADLNAVRRDYLHRDDFKEFKIELRQMFDELKQDIKEIKARQ